MVNLRTGFSVRLAMIAACVLMALMLCSCATQNEVAVRDAVNDYSWGELSALSDEIAAAPDEESALQIAVAYHLVNDEGKLDGSQVKEIELADGSVARAAIADFRHDDLHGGNKAGITFVFEDAVALRPMNNNAGFDDLDETDAVSATGGWTGSDARDWLNADFVDELPADLQLALKDVVKRSCVVPEKQAGGQTGQGALNVPVESLMGESVDKLWLLALAELAEVSDETYYAEVNPEWTDVMRAEGTPYKLFADAGVDEFGSYDVLKMACLDGSQKSMPCAWWLRSVEDWTFVHVTKGGSIERDFEAVNGGDSLGIVACFAI